MGALETFLANLAPGQAGAMVKAFGPILQDMAHTQKCLAEGLADVRKQTRSSALSVGYEFGAGMPDLPAYDPRKLPYTQELKTSVGQTQPALLKRVLSKPATRGSIENLGENPAILYLQQERNGDNVTQRKYYLSPGRVLDITFALDSLVAETLNNGDEIWVQVIAQ